jgi:hypothetical protein
MGCVLSTLKESLSVATNDAAEKFVSPFDGDIYPGKEVSYVWSVNKVMRLVQYNSVFIFKLRIEFVPFKIVPLGGYTPPETLFPPFVAALEVANRNRF